MPECFFVISSLTFNLCLAHDLLSTLVLGPAKNYKNDSNCEAKCYFEKYTIFETVLSWFVLAVHVGRNKGVGDFSICRSTLPFPS